MQYDECRVQNEDAEWCSPAFILHFVFCILHSAFLLERFDISYSVSGILEEAAAVGGGYRCDGVGDGLA